MISAANMGKQTEAAKRALLAYIWEKHLSPGERMPSQTELRTSLGLGGTTIDRAVRALVREGVLSVRRGVGMFVKNPQPLGHPGYMVGLAGLFTENIHIANATLAHTVEAQLYRHGCRCVSFPHTEMSVDYSKSLSLAALPGLTETLRRRELQGILTFSMLDPKEWAQIEAEGVKVCYFGIPADICCGVIIDTAWFVEQGLREVLRAGFLRPRILIGPLNVMLETEIHAAIVRVLAEFPELPIGNPGDLLLHCGYHRDCRCEFRHWAHNFFTLPSDERPDALVLCDDLRAMSFFAELVRIQNHTLDYLPFSVSMQNRELNIELPLPRQVTYWIELAEIGRLATELLLGRLASENPRPPEVIRYRPIREVVDYSACESREAAMNTGP